MANLAAQEPPNGFQKASVDDKGRLKLNAKCLSYLDKIEATKFFITSLDNGKTGKIYTLPVWAENKKKLLEATGSARQAAKDVLFMAQWMGDDAELDSAGRLLLPSTLRKELGLEKGGAVQLDPAQGVFTIYTDPKFDSRLVEAKEDYDQKFEKVDDLGLA